VSTNRPRPPAFVFDQWQRALLLADPARPLMLPAQDMPDAIPATMKGDRRLDAGQLALVRHAMQEAFRAASEDPGRFVCRSKAWCVAVMNEGVAIAAVEDGRLAGIACDMAGFVIAPRVRFDECRSGALLVNGAMLRKAGALEIYVNGKRDIEDWRVVTAMAAIDRSWSRHRSFDWRAGEFDRSLPEGFARMISDSDG